MNRRIFSVLAVALLAGCAATKSGDAEDIRFAGFLSSYSGLVKTDDSDMAAFRYVKPSMELSSYNGILLEKSEARMTAEALQSVGEEDMAYVLGAFDEAFRTELAKKYRLVNADGPGVLRIRACLTDADSATGALTPFSRLLPVGIVLSTTKKVATGTAINVGKVTAEMELIDSATGEQLAAAVDRRIGTGVARNMLTDWGDVKDVFDTWAERMSEWLEKQNMPRVK
jgi:hypothetical protein